VALLTQALEQLKVPIVREAVLRVYGDADGVVAETASGSFRGATGISPRSPRAAHGAVSSGPHTIRPVHGVTARVQGIDRANLPTIRAFVRGRTFYMVSRPGGYCVLGATAEERTEPTVQVGESAAALARRLDIVPSSRRPACSRARWTASREPDLRPFFERLETRGWAVVVGPLPSWRDTRPHRRGPRPGFVEGGA